jgi:hypothetical protein
VDTELEESITDVPFKEFTLTRGNAQSAIFGGVQNVGTFKARFRLIELSKRHLYPPPLNLKVKPLICLTCNELFLIVHFLQLRKRMHPLHML